MQTNENDIKVEKGVGMHSNSFERPCKHQIVTDTKSRNPPHLFQKHKKYKSWLKPTRCYTFEA